MGVVIEARSSHGKVQAELTCAAPGCSEVHVRESSDWHHCAYCRKHSPSARSATASARARTQPRPPAPLTRAAREVTASAPGKLHFDAYLMVDWSANGEPKTGKDSIWWCTGEWDHDRLVIGAAQNPATRQRAYVQLYEELHRLAARGASVLVGLDFAFGYPRGLAAYLGLAAPGWSAIWSEWARLLRDVGENESNRLDVAGELNLRLGAVAGPFWGNGENRDVLGLTRDRHFTFPVLGLEERRLTERRVPRAHSVWKLAYKGAVGSQALCGIPYALALRHAPGLTGRTMVWPFETGFELPAPGEGHRIILAEVYPSLVAAVGDPESVPDEAQVRALASHFAQLDAHGDLERCFGRPEGLDDRQVRDVLKEEGWILGT